MTRPVFGVDPPPGRRVDYVKPEEPRIGPEGVEWVERPVARSTDPGTSWDAADSVTRIRASQGWIVAILRDHPGGLTDEQIWAELKQRGYAPLRISLSGARTRRREVTMRPGDLEGKLLRDSGLRVRGSTGRRMIVWTLR